MSNGTSLNWSIFILPWMVLLLIPAADDAREPSSRCGKAIEVLRDPFIIEYANDGAPSDPCKGIVRLISLSSGGEDVVGAIPQITHLKNPEEITLELRVFDARQIEPLAERADVLEMLKAVEISVDMDTPVSGAELRQLSKISNLRVLHISSLERLQINDASLAFLKKLGQLETLSLNNTRVTDAGLAHLKTLNKLEFLSLLSNDISGEGLRHLGKLPLRRLFLAGTKVDDAGLQSLRHFKHLQDLVLTSCPIEGPGLKHLAELKSLRRLSLSKTEIDDAALRHLLKLRELKDLALVGCKITDKAVEHLKQLKTLKELPLTDTKMTKRGIRRLQNSLPNTVIQY